MNDNIGEMPEDTKYTFRDNLDKLPDVQVFDNKGKTWDRYTVLINGDVYTMSVNADDPNGFNQFVGDLEYLQIEDVKSEKWGKEVELTDLPDNVRRAIGHRLASYMEDYLTA